MEDIVFGRSEVLILDEKTVNKKHKGFKLFCAKNLKNQDVVRNILRKVDIVYGCEFHNYKDHGHQSNSGLDVVIAKEMKQKNVSYGICVSDVLDALNKENLILHRLKQNIMILDKKKVPIVVFSGKKKYSEGERKFLEYFFRHI